MQVRIKCSTRAHRKLHELLLATAWRAWIASLSASGLETASSIAATKPAVSAAMATTSEYFLISASGVETTGLPAARYSKTLIGLTDFVSALIRNGMRQTEKCCRNAGS